MVYTTFTEPYLTGVTMKNVKVSSVTNCLSKRETDISMEMLAQYKNILERERIDYRSIKSHSL